jgi:hypothetical protein
LQISSEIIVILFQAMKCALSDEIEKLGDITEKAYELAESMHDYQRVCTFFFVPPLLYGVEELF